jgi:hypothetical protein
VQHLLCTCQRELGKLRYSNTLVPAKSKYQGPGLAPRSFQATGGTLRDRYPTELEATDFDEAEC